MGKFTDKEYAEYMLANYVLGSVDIALFIGMSLFEKYFHKKLSERKHKFYSKENSLEKCIDWYCEDTRSDPLAHGSELICNKLHAFRKLRNDFTHGFDDNQIIRRKNEIEKLILYVYHVFYPLEKYDATITVISNKDRLLLHDYKIKELTERMMERFESEMYKEDSSYIKLFSGFEEEDFENLFELRKKMIFLSRNLEKSFKSFSIKRNIISPIDTTSAYIWMPFCIEHAQLEENSFLTERKNLIQATTSILVTPVDFRLYIDFGGGDFTNRLHYQKFLQTNEFKEYCKFFSYLHQDICLFDTKWYSYITSQNSLYTLLKNEQDFTKKVDSSIEFLESSKSPDKVITKNYNLLGYILPANKISKEQITLYFAKVLHFYIEFLKSLPCNEKLISIYTASQNKIIEDFNLRQKKSLSEDDYFKKEIGKL